MTRATYRQDCLLVVAVVGVRQVASIVPHCHIATLPDCHIASAADGSLNNTTMNCPVIAVRSFLEDDNDMNAYYR